MPHSMRRSDRAVSQENAFEILRKSAYGVLSLTNGAEPYGVPLCFCLSQDRTHLLFHAAGEGRKIEMIRVNPRVHFSACAGFTVFPDALAIAYESAMVEGVVSEVTDPETKIAAACLLARKYGASYEPVDYARKAMASYRIFSLAIENLSGKRFAVPDAAARQSLERKKRDPGSLV